MDSNRSTKGLGLNSRNINIEGLNISTQGKKPTGAELLQCLALLTNMGHFPDTFSTSKVWLHLLHKNVRGLRTGFKKGLKAEDKKLLDTVIENFDVYNVHLINALFLLERYRRVDGGNEVVDFSKKLLIEYMTGEHEELRKYWSIYKGIRKIAYVLMDSHYAPIPFNLDLSSIMLNLDRYQEAIINNSSTFQKALDQMNNVLENSLYIEPSSLLISSLRSNQIYQSFSDSSSIDQLDKVSNIKYMLEPVSKKSEDLSSIFQKNDEWAFPEPDWDNNNFLDITYSEVDYYKTIFPLNVWEFEQELNRSLGITSCIVSTSYPPSKNNFRLVFAVKENLSETKKISKSLDIVKKAIELDVDLKKKGFIKNNQSEDEFRSRLLKYLLSYSFGMKNDFTLDYPVTTKINEVPLFIGRGSVNVSNEINRYINIIKNDLNADQIHELEMTRATVLELDYRGLIMAFLGSTKIRKQKESTFSCEFDGVIFLPYQKKGNFVFVIEAKNKPNGNTEARTQLVNRLNSNLSNQLEYELNDLGSKGAYASISFRIDEY
jgi:hypothetical protein